MSHFFKFTFLVWLCGSSIFSNCNMLPKEPKSVIDQVISNENGVFLLMDDLWLCTDGFQTKGLDSYVMLEGQWIPLHEAIECGSIWIKSWECNNCHQYNLEGVNACAYCGKSRYE